MSEDFDVIVVGCGPAGSVFARLLAKAGARVLALDKKPVIGQPVRCGEGITDKWLHHERVPSYAIAARINGARLYSPSDTMLELRTHTTRGFVLHRELFDKHLATLAAQAGAIVAPATNALKLRRAGAVWRLLVAHNGRRRIVRAPLVVSAEGMEATIAQQAGFDTFIAPYDVDKCFEYELAAVECSNMIEIWLGNARSPRGYCWLFPKGRAANVGIGIGGHINAAPKQLLDAFIARSAHLRGGVPVAYKSGVISVGPPLKRFVADGFIVVGTAARQVDPLHGGGIGLAIEAAHLAASAARTAFECGDWSATTLSTYEATWRRMREPILAKRLRLRKALEALSDADLDYIFSAVSAEELQRIIEGDWKAIVMRLVVKRPSLLKAVKGLL